MEIKELQSVYQLSDEQKNAIQRLSGISRLDVVNTITTGRSGSAVFVVDVWSQAGNGLEGRFILKIGEPGDAERERKSHEEAFQTSIQQYMTTLAASSPKPSKNEANLVAVLYKLARHTLIDTQPLKDYIEYRQNNATKQIAKLAEVLRNWNTPLEIRRSHPNELLRNILGDLVKSGKTIQRVAQEEFGISDINKSLFFQGSNLIFPNPIAYAVNENLWNPSLSMVWPGGQNIHYDLHSLNIICHVEDKDPTPILIDFRKYEKRENIAFYDYLYLEFDLLLHIMPPETRSTRSEWLELGAALAENFELDAEFDGSPGAIRVWQLLQPLRKNLKNTAIEYNQLDEFTNAHLLTAVAIGLNWFRKSGLNEHQRKLSLLLASQRLLVLLKRLNLEINPDKTANLNWISEDRKENSELASLHKSLRNQLTPVLSERRAILILGSEVSRWLGLPSERVLAERVARRHNLTVPDPVDEDDPSCFDQLMKTDEQTKDQIRLTVANLYKTEPKRLDEIEQQINGLLRANWLAILDWSFSSVLLEKVSQNLTPSRRITSISNLEDTSKIDLRNLFEVPWIFLRGEIRSVNSLVLGYRGWGANRQNRNYREAALEHLLKTGVQDSDVTIVFLGCRGKILEEINTLIELIYQKDLESWIISRDIDQDPIARQLDSYRDGTNLISLDVGDFCNFLINEISSQETTSSTQAQSYVMELAGIEIADEETQTIDSSEPGSVRRASDPSKIVELLIPEAKYYSLKNYFEFLYRGIEQDSSEEPHILGGDFYRGYDVTWRDLAAGYDVPRTLTKEILQNTILPDLEDQAPRIIRFLGEPGSGATTIALRIAWEVYQSHHIPVVIVRRTGLVLNNLFDAIEQFRELVNRSFLLVADEEYIKTEEVERLYEKAQGQLIPVVILHIGRKANQNQIRETDNKGTRRRRHFFLKDELDKRELANFRSKLLPFIPEVNLENFNESHQEKSLFINLLIAFEEEFVRIDRMVKSLLKGISESSKELLIAIAFCERYANQSAPISFLANLTDYSRDKIEVSLESFVNQLVFVDDSQELEACYRCRHDLIALQILRELVGNGVNQDSWKSALVDQAIYYLKKLATTDNSEVNAGRAWQEGFIKRLLSEKFIKIAIRIRRDEYWVSRLCYEVELPASRGRILEQAAKSFPDVASVLADYGRFLYDEVTEFSKSRTYLQQAFDLTDQKSSDFSQRLGMSYRRELQEELRNEGDLERISSLLSKASDYFTTARQLNPENQYAYTAHVQCFIDLIKHSFSRSKKKSSQLSNLDILRANSDARSWMDEAFGLLDEAQFYFDFEEGSLLAILENELIELRGDVSLAISTYRNMLNVLKNPGQSKQSSVVKRQLARLLYQRGIGKVVSRTNKEKQKAIQDLQESAQYFDSLIKEDPSKAHHLSSWFRCVRAIPDFVEKQWEVTEKLEQYYARTESLDGAFYLMCLYFTQCIFTENNAFAARKYQQYLSECKQLSSNLSHRLDIKREWLGHQGILIPNRSLSFDSQRREPVTKDLPRIDGRVVKVEDSYGEIEIAPSGLLKIYFPAKRREQKFYRSDADYHTEVTFNVAFLYDKPIAYDVRRALKTEF